MKRTLLYLAVLCFTAAFSQRISDLLTEPSPPKRYTHKSLETYDSYKTYRAGLEKKKQEEKMLYTNETATRLKNYKFGDYLIVTSKTADIKSGEGNDFKTIHTIKQDGLLKFNSFDGHWVKVTVIDSGETGYIYYKNVK